MTRFDGSAALKLDFGGVTGVTTTGALTLRASGLRLAVPSGGVCGPDKYKVLEHRRRQAQIRARHLLKLTEEAR